MTLGQIMLGVRGLELSAEEREMLAHPQVGGVILFTRNFHDRQQLQELVRQIHALRRPRLLVAVDQEGGRVQRFRNEFLRLPPVGDLGSVYDRDPVQGKAQAEALGWLMAAELRAVGIDLSFAPVLDLGRGISQVVGDRAFHADPAAVVDLAGSYIQGMRQAGMMATGKHFPGHGSVVPDSHYELPRDERDMAAIQAEDLVPFAGLIQTGLAAVMTAHVIYPTMDALPAGFSRVWIEDILRAQLGFQGAVFSDDLGMQAAGCIGDLSQRASAALEAGCDMILLCNEHDQFATVLDAVPREPNPVAALRLTRLHGRPGTRSWESLHRSAEWRERVRRVERLLT